MTFGADWQDWLRTRSHASAASVGWTPGGGGPMLEGDN
jgi:hypothetical protein